MDRILGSKDGMSFDPLPHFPTSDQDVWCIDEGAALEELYGMLTAAEQASYNNGHLNQVLELQDVNHNQTAPQNQMEHIQLYNRQYPVASNHIASIPALSNQGTTRLNHFQPVNPQGNYEMPLQNQSSVLPLPPRYEVNKNGIDNPLTQSLFPPAKIPSLEKPKSLEAQVDSAFVTFVDLKTFYEKGQCRLQGKSEQRLDYASAFVRIYLEDPDKVQAKSAFVERSPDAAHIIKDNVGQVLLNIMTDKNDHWIKVNLDDAGSEVYKLSKVKGEERNLFRVGLKLLFKDANNWRTFYSDSFQVKSKPKTAEISYEDCEKPTVKVEPELTKRPVKRLRMDEQDITTSPLSNGSSIFPEVITDHLEATTANIKQLKVSNPIQTPRGDIAYHFKLKGFSNSLQLEEGDLIGFFENPEDGSSEIRKLTCGNAPHAKLAGVISRSAWIEGKTPGDDDKERTDVVCVIGVVKVKVRGVVENGERIYASINSYPGMAMPEHVIKQVTSQDLTLIGQSLETVNNVSPDEVSLVSCFVSILLSIQTQHTTKALSDMRVDVLGNVDKKIFTAKRIIVRGIGLKLLIFFIFLGLLGVFLYQVYAPLTAYRYWRCSMGSVDDSTSSFTFTTFNFQVPRVNGIEFTFDKLQDKLDEKYVQKKNDSTDRYYLNIDRCAVGGRPAYGIRGPKFFVIDGKCNVAYYYFSGTYRKYNSGRNFLCSFHQDNCVGCDISETSSSRTSPLKENITIQPTLDVTGNYSMNVTQHPSSAEDKCLRSSTHTGSANFKYNSRSRKEVTVEGIEVTVEELRSWFEMKIGRVRSSLVARYFYNRKRCTTKNAGGPKFFAILGNCESAHYYSRGRWVRYNSGRDVTCST